MRGGSRRRSAAARSGYRDGFDRTDPVGLRDVTFDRAQYEDALRATAQG